MYNESGDGGSSSSSGNGQGPIDPNRQVFPGYTNQRINDALADAPFLDELMEGGGGGAPPPAEDVIMEEEAPKTPEASNSPKNDASGAQKSPEARSPPPGAQKSPEVDAESIEEAPESPGDDVYYQKSEEPLAPTQLGTALDSLMMSWCQLLTNVTVKPPVPPPSTLDHAKEVAEVCSKHFRDASVDVNNELTRLGVQWEMEETTEQSAMEEASLDEAIERQQILLQQATDIIRTRVEAYEKECPNAGKLLNT